MLSSGPKMLSTGPKILSPGPKMLSPGPKRCHLVQVNLGRLPNMVSLSNMPIDKQGVPIPGSE